MLCSPLMAKRVTIFRAQPAAAVGVEAAHKARPDQLLEEHQLAFARSFTRTAVYSCFRSRGLRSTLMPLAGDLGFAPLTGEAEANADALGASLAKEEVAALTYSLGAIYTSALPASYRSTHGVFYTPPEVVEHLLQMAEHSGVNWSTARVLDPACGGGAFLVGVAKRMIAALRGTDSAIVLQNVGARLRGFETDPFGVWLGQAMLQTAMHEFLSAPNRTLAPIVEKRDSLDLKEDEYEQFDLVLGNPPFGRISLDPGRRDAYARSLYGHANLYGLFTDAALRWTKYGGIIAYVTPTSMVSGLYFKALRRVLAAEAPPHRVDFVTDRRGVFDDVLQETMLATYRRGGFARGGCVGVMSLSEQRVNWRRTGTLSLPTKPEAPWILPRSADQGALARRLSNMRHRLSHYGYEVSTGPLVWNRHKAQFRPQSNHKYHPVIWAEAVTSDGRFSWRSEKRNHAPWFAAQQPKDDWLIVNRACVLVQRTTAKEQTRRLIAAVLPPAFVRQHRGVVIENHLNMVRATSQKPKVSPAVIAALLNSAALDAAFRCISGSVAVSAFELEELPLPSPSVLARLTNLIASNASTAKMEAVIAMAYQRRDASAAP